MQRWHGVEDVCQSCGTNVEGGKGNGVVGCRVAERDDYVRVRLPEGTDQGDGARDFRGEGNKADRG